MNENTTKYVQSIVKNYKDKTIQNINIEAKEWFDSYNGNSYFGGIITVCYEDLKVLYFPLAWQYGYGDHYIAVAADVLREFGVIDSDNHIDPLYRICQDNNIHLNTSKHENNTKADSLGFAEYGQDNFEQCFELTHIDVIFKQEDEQAIAFFPYAVERDGSVDCYYHVGQHSTANWDYAVKLKKASPEMIDELTKELEGSVGYILNVIKRRNHSKYIAEYNRVNVILISTKEIKERLEYLREELRKECISQGELIELQSLAEHIDKGDVELLEAAGVPES